MFLSYSPERTLSYFDLLKFSRSTISHFNSTLPWNFSWTKLLTAVLSHNFAWAFIQVFVRRDVNVHSDQVIPHRFSLHITSLNLHVNQLRQPATYHSRQALISVWLSINTTDHLLKWKISRSKFLRAFHRFEINRWLDNDQFHKKHGTTVALPFSANSEWKMTNGIGDAVQTMWLRTSDKQRNTIATLLSTIFEYSFLTELAKCQSEKLDLKVVINWAFV